MMKMKRLKSGKKDPLFQPNISIFTKIVFWAGIIAFGIQFYLGMMHVNDADAFGRNFGILALWEASFAFVGILLTDVVRGHGFPPQQFRDLDPKTLEKTLITFIIIAVVQLAIFFIPLTISDYEMAMGIVFAAPAEELFFRAFLMSIFIRVGYDSQNKIDLFGKKKISYVEIAGIIISSVAFMFLHVNYYGNISAMLTVFFGGIALALIYWWWRDLTVVVFAHLLLNILVVGKDFFLVNLV
jgi:membrane protease YdiL (CAAX protease family)